MLRTVLILSAIVAIAPCANAAPSQPRAGQYVLEGDSGTLTIRKKESSDLHFEIETVGVNGHTCSVSGEIRGTTGHSDSDDSGSRCEIAFSYDRHGVVVTPVTEEGCRAYCGARAGFDGTYRIPPRTCTAEGRQAQRDRFLQLYRTQRYPEATSTLQALMARCEKFIGWIEADKVRNDLALSQYHSGDFAQCLDTLNGTLAGTAKDEDDLKNRSSGVSLGPYDFEMYIDVARATWDSKALCTTAMSRSR